MYNVFKRPMFKLGGQADLGTGIMSTIEPKQTMRQNPYTGYAIGGRIGYANGPGPVNFFSPEVVTDEERATRSDIYPYEKRNVEELLNFTPIGRIGSGLNILRQAGRFPEFPAGYPSRGLTQAPFLSNQYFRETLRPYVSGATETLKQAGTGIKDFAKKYGVITGIGGAGGAAIYGGLGDEKKQEEPTVDSNKKNIDPTVQALIDENKKLQELLYSGGGQEITRADDVKSVVEDLLPIFKEQLGVSEDEYSRQKYLELAKFGLNLLRQPGGPPGGKRDLLGAIAAAGEKPLEGYASIVEKERQAQKLPRALALETAIKLSEPGTMAKNINDLMKTGEFKSKAEAIAFLGKEGSAAARNLQERVISEYGIKIADDFDMKSTAATQAARKLFPYRDKINIAEFKPFPSKKEERIVGSKYIDKETGRFGIFNGTGLIEPGDPGYVF